MLQCTLYSVEYTQVHCTLYSIHVTMHNVHCRVYTLQSKSYTGQTNNFVELVGGGSAIKGANQSSFSYEWNYKEMLHTETTVSHNIDSGKGPNT